MSLKERQSLERLNTYHKTIVCGMCLIIEYIDSNNVKVKFDDGTIVKTRWNKIKSGNIRNANHPTVYDIGYVGLGENTRTTHPKAYSCWINMLQRCYSYEYIELKPTYKDCYVDKKWLNFQNFVLWYDKNYIDGFQLDKDILFKGNKKYSENTCCFVPPKINYLFTLNNSNRNELGIGVIKNKNDGFVGLFNGKYGAKTQKKKFETKNEAFLFYKKLKENHIKEIANENKNVLPKNVYEALINYVVEESD